MPTKSEWDRHLKKIYEGKASIAEVAEELGVEKKDVSQMYDRFLKDLLEEREKKLSQIEKEAGEKERKIKSLSEGIERTEKKLKETEEKLPKIKKLEKMGEDWEQKIRKFANTWKKAKKRIRNILIIGVLILAFGVGIYFLSGGGDQNAEFKVENLEISSKEAFVENSIKVSLDVVNVGRSEGTYKASLKFNGATVGDKEIVLAPDESKTITVTGTVKENGINQVRIGGLTDNFRAFKSFPFKGAYVKYETGGSVEPFGKASGTEKYEVTEVTGKDYTWDFTPTDDIAGLAEAEIIKKAQEYTTSLKTPISIADDEKWEENFKFIENVTQNTEFGTMKLRSYLGIENEVRTKIHSGYLTKIHSVYLEGNTGIPLRYELVFTLDGKIVGTLVGKLVETNVNYLKEN